MKIHAEREKKRKRDVMTTPKGPSLCVAPVCCLCAALIHWSMGSVALLYLTEYLGNGIL